MLKEDNKSKKREFIFEEVEEAPEITELKNSIDKKFEASFICESQETNPNYFFVIYANQGLYDQFKIRRETLFGKGYDFLFADLGFGTSFDEQTEYAEVVRIIKNFKPNTLVLSLRKNLRTNDKGRFNLSILPVQIANQKVRHLIFTITKADNQDEIRLETTYSSEHLALKLKRSIRNEQILRQIGDFIISDMRLSEVANNTAKLMCESFNVSRCIIHDYQEGHTNFISEHCEDLTKAMVNLNDPESLKIVTKYINFQNHFFERYGSKEKNVSITVAEDIASDNTFDQLEPIFRKFLINSQVAINTSFNGKINGAIYLHLTEKRSWIAEEINLMEGIANILSIALDRSSSIERTMLINHALGEKTAQLEESLQHEQEMRKVQNEFVALVSHEFKTPLQIIDSTRELMVRKIKNLGVVDDSLSKSLERIKGSIDRMNGLISSVLNLAKIEGDEKAIKVEKSTFNLKNFVTEIVERNSNLAANKNIKIITKISDLPTIFDGDQKLLDHSITNIITNAIKYSKNNFSIKILAKANEKKVAIRIIDQGIGIPENDLSNIGKKFFRAKNTLAIAGTGIGLYLTKHFIELHGGEILITSQVDIGTSVTITIPRN